MTKMLACKVPDQVHERVEKKARSVPYRTVSDYLRELVDKDLAADDEPKDRVDEKV